MFFYIYFSAKNIEINSSFCFYIDLFVNFTTHFNFKKIKKRSDNLFIMKRIKILIAVFITTLSYVLISFVVGKNGILVYKNLLEQKKAIALRTDSIQQINNDLQLEYNALSKDKSVLQAYARKLDYVSDGEKLVKISGLKPYQNTLYDTGTVLKHKDSVYLPESACKIISLVIGFLSFVLMFLFDVNKGNVSFSKKKKTFVEGIPVYEVPQV